MYCVGIDGGSCRTNINRVECRVDSSSTVSDMALRTNINRVECRGSRIKWN